MLSNNKSIDASMNCKLSCLAFGTPEEKKSNKIYDLLLSPCEFLPQREKSQRKKIKIFKSSNDDTLLPKLIKYLKTRCECRI